MKFPLPWTMSRGNGSGPDPVLGRLEALQRQRDEVEQRRTSLDERERELEHLAVELEERKAQQLTELERLASLSVAQARQALVEEVEKAASQQAARALRRIEAEAKLEADRRGREILASSIQRLAGGQTAQTTTREVQLPNDEMKGRIIGRDGRNIRTLESLTGVDFIIDATPAVVMLSSFDGVRREIARLTLEKLIADGRIHPARCEEAYAQAKAEIEGRIVEEAEHALLDARVGEIHPQLLRLLGRLRFRTSYGQNVLDHLIECSQLAGLLATELGADAELARRAGLLHDIGKAAGQDVEGTHAMVGARLARRFGEEDGVVHAIEAHHDEVEPRTVEAALVQAADAVSGARPGARGSSLEEYVDRLRDLEAVARQHPGVQKVYAMQAGREIRVMVDPGEIDDDEAALISHEIATEIEREMDYPGQIKITVIRESRATTFAR